MKAIAEMDMGELVAYKNDLWETYHALHLIEPQDTFDLRRIMKLILYIQRRIKELRDERATDRRDIEQRAAEVPMAADG